MSNSNFDLFAGAPKGPTRSANPLTVTQLNQRARQLLERQMGQVSVVGEVSNYKIAGGHHYFALKDHSSNLPAALFKREASRVKFRITNGMEVVVTGRLTLYVPYGRYQIVCDSIEPKGVGSLALAFEQLKEKLGQEGLFAEERKRELPLVPRRVGVVTSPTGAVIRDIIHVATRRFPNAQLLLIPSKVQGADAAPTIVEGIRRAGQMARELGLDALIVGRGGGSMEDLWGYNDERVARAIASCPLPVVSAVGHETDFTIADFVADRRAPTPSAAAELLFPVKSDLMRALNGNLDRSRFALSRELVRYRGKIDVSRRLLGDGKGLLRDYLQRLSFEQERLRHGVSGTLMMRRLQLQDLEARLGAAHPRVGLQNTRVRLGALSERLGLAGRHCVEQRQASIRFLAGRLRALSPLGVLERGYGIVLGDDGQAIRGASEVKEGDRVDIRLMNGSLRARVEEVSA